MIFILGSESARMFLDNTYTCNNKTVRKFREKQNKTSMITSKFVLEVNVILCLGRLCLFWLFLFLFLLVLFHFSLNVTGGVTSLQISSCAMTWEFKTFVTDIWAKLSFMFLENTDKQTIKYLFHL